MSMRVACVLIAVFFICWCAKKRAALSRVALNQDRFRHKKDFVILWDIHGVLFTKNIFHWFYLIVTYKDLFAALKGLDRKSIAIIVKYVLRKIGLYRTEMTNEELIAAARSNNNHALIALIMRVSCDYHPNVPVLNMVKLLQQKGYRQQAASNIGATVFQEFSFAYRTVFSYFESIFMVRVVPGQPVLKKPNAEYFHAYLKEKHMQPDKLLFIDDRLDNVLAAQKIGIPSLLFVSSDQLKADLVSLGLF